MRDSNKEQLMLSIDKEVKRKAKEKIKNYDKSLSSIAEHAFKEFINQSVTCPRKDCKARYHPHAIGKEIKKCSKCGKKLI